MSSTKQIITKKSKGKKPTRRFPTAVWNYIKDFAGIKNSKILNRFLQPLPLEELKTIKRIKKIMKEIDAMPRWCEQVIRWKYNDYCYDSYHEQMITLSEDCCSFANYDLKTFYEMRRFIEALDLTEKNSGCNSIIKECIERFQEQNPDWKDDKQPSDDIIRLQCIGCNKIQSQGETFYTECGGEQGVNMCEKCFT